MSFFDDASLAFLPSGAAGKDGKAYSIKPTDGTGDFTFTRGSNLSATRVNASQLIEKGRENILLQSNSFDTNWIGSAAIATSGQSGYDGTNDAWLLTKTADTYANIRQDITFSGVHTFSVYLKQGTNTSAILRTTGGTAAKVEINLIDGTTSGTSNDISVKTESIGNNWWRCSLTLNASSDTAVRIYPEAPLGGANAGNIYIQDAQLESSLVATDVIETTTTTGKAGILEDTPRFDYSGGATCPSLLLEPSRTNLVPQSEYFGEWSVSASGTGVTPVRTANAAISPEGLQNAYEVTFDTGSNTTTSDISILTETIGGQGAGDYVLSFWAKVLSGTGEIVARGAGSYLYTTCNLNSEWQRFEIKETLASPGTISIAIGLRRGLANEPLNSSVTCQIYGAQVEEATYATSYIPTYGVSQTRASDVCVGAGDAATFNDSEGVLYAETSVLSNDLNIEAISISDGTGSNRVVVFKWNTSNLIRARVTSGGANINLDFQVPDITSINKIAVKYKTNDFALWINGVKVRTNTSGSNPSGLNQLAFNSDGGNGAPFYGNTKQVIVFPTALSDSDLATLTTI